ncbi:hypothetical protein [Pseudonocardia sp. ICBG1293]|uniref:DUF6885 family protein n=1 Tax=Pseudonocardia sp. ICBG1293 TaxID=2844382 RepID=UPI001CCD38F8|nr:hypothetical protein [Pseudonocardia sp. ICBG1293]
MSPPVPSPVRAFPGAEALLRVHAASLPQPDQLAGPFVARLLVAALSPLPAPTVAAFAHAAGTRVRAGDDASDRPPGAPADPDYLRGLPPAADDEWAGTPVAGLGRAVEEFSGESLAAVPASGEWTGGALVALLDAATTDDAAGPVGVLVELATGELGAAATSVADLDAGARPGPDWSAAAHVVALWGRRDGPGGPLLAVADTYPQLGSPDLGPGLHLQPADRVAAALGHGGLVLVGPASRRADLAAAVEGAGLRVRWWDDPA